MLFELALNGIGGSTPHEVKSNLAGVEIQQWAEYRAIRGSLNIGRRVEQAIGNLMSFYANSKIADASKQYHPIEFMPNEDDIEIGFEEQLEV